MTYVVMFTGIQIMQNSTLTITEIGYLLEEIILVVDRDKRVLYCNKDVEGYFGEDETLLHKHTLHPRELKISSYFYDLAQSATPDQSCFQTTHTNKDKVKVTIEWKSASFSSNATENSPEKTTTFLLIGKDISSESIKNERIDDLEIQLNSVIEIMEGNYWWKDVNGVYKGFNHSLTSLLGVSHEEVIGHTDYDLPWSNTADTLVKNDQQVMASGQPLKTEEEVKATNGKNRIFEIFKIPLKNKKGEIIGTIGNSIDITERKKAEEKELRLKKEIERQQLLALQEKEKLIALAHKVAHDITSPLTALNMMMRSCNELPENKRMLVKRATESILDIANNLLNTYRKEEQHAKTEIEQPQPVLISDLIAQLLSEKKVQYCNSPITFETTIASDAHFAFALLQKTEFRRSMSNLINNAVDALKNKVNGIVTIQLTANSEQVTVEILDNGKGMSSDVIEKILQRKGFTAGKEHGHGLGLQQVGDTLERNQGIMEVHSALSQGTSIKITFPRITAPNWIAQEIQLNNNNTVVILDDDDAIHTAWDLRFASFLESHPNLRLHHFKQGQEALDFFSNLSSQEKSCITFLSDYELLRQSKNGLQIIEAIQIHHSILVTSYYANPTIQNEADQLGVKILPKQMASVIPIILRPLASLARLLNDRHL